MRQRRIGVDGYALALPNGTGIATYARVLAETLAAGDYRVEGVFGVDPGADRARRGSTFLDNLLHPRVPEVGSPEHRLRRRRILARALAPPGSLRAEDVAEDGLGEGLAAHLPAFARIATRANLFEIAHRRFALTGRMLTMRVADPPDVMHWTYPIPIRMAGARNVYTLHDLVPLKLPYTTLDNKRLYHATVRACIAAASRICTVSEASRADIRSFFPLDPDSVVNTYQAAPREDGVAATRVEDAAAVRDAFGLEQGGYFLFFGAIEPKKNIGRMLEAFLSAGLDTPLVIVGARAWRSEGELALLPPQPGPRIVQLPYQPRAMLARLLRGARALLFPSLYEGFGLPVLEANRVGTPVLTANTSSLPEVAGPAAIYADPYSAESIAAALVRLDRDADLRARLSAAGPAQADRFSRARYLERLGGLYDAALSAPLS